MISTLKNPRQKRYRDRKADIPRHAKERAAQTLTCDLIDLIVQRAALWSRIYFSSLGMPLYARYFRISGRVPLGPQNHADSCGCISCLRTQIPHAQPQCEVDSDRSILATGSRRGRRQTSRDTAVA